MTIYDRRFQYQYGQMQFRAAPMRAQVSPAPSGAGTLQNPVERARQLSGVDLSDRHVYTAGNGRYTIYMPPGWDDAQKITNPRPGLDIHRFAVVVGPDFQGRESARVQMGEALLATDTATPLDLDQGGAIVYRYGVGGPLGWPTNPDTLPHPADGGSVAPWVYINKRNAKVGDTVRLKTNMALNPVDMRFASLPAKFRMNSVQSFDIELPDALVQCQTGKGWIGDPGNNLNIIYRLPGDPNSPIHALNITGGRYGCVISEIAPVTNFAQPFTPSRAAVQVRQASVIPTTRTIRRFTRGRRR